MACKYLSLQSVENKIVWKNVSLVRIVLQFTPDIKIKFKEVVEQSTHV